jgi:uncharacterized protein
MIVVVDCNIVVSAAWNGGICLSALRYCIDHDLLVASVGIIAEYERVADYPKLSKIRHRLVRLIEDIKERAWLVEDGPCIFSLPDPKDEPYLAVAAKAEADLVVSGNLKHFPERQYGTIEVVSVREFATLVGIDG